MRYFVTQGIGIANDYSIIQAMITATSTLISTNQGQSQAEASTNRLSIIRLSGFILFAICIIFTAWIAKLYTQLDELRNHNPEQSAFMQQATADRPGMELRHHWVNYDQISRQLKRAVIAAEDAKFMQHSGFDWEGIQLALEKNLERGHIAAGGSTISQQLAKNLFLSPDRSLIRKAEEAIITAMMEHMLSKQRILELYLNYAEWGKGIYGAEAASRHYFGIPASRLSAWQAARLAAILPNPRYYDGRRSNWVVEKGDIIINRMPKVQTPR